MRDYYRYRFRNARDTLIDRVAAIGERMLNHNLPVTTLQSVVPYETSTLVYIDYTQPEVAYTLLDDRGWQSEPHEGNGERIEIETGTLTYEYHTFSVEARPKGLRTVGDLHQRVTVKVGPEIDLKVNLVQEVIDYDAAARVRIVDSQANACYQVFDRKGKALSEKVCGAHQKELYIPLQPLRENAEIKIKTTLEKTRVEAWQLQELKLLVRPNLEIALTADGNDHAQGELGDNAYVCAFNHPAKLFIKNSQRSTYYRLRYQWVDDDDAHLDLNRPVLDDKQGTGGDLPIVIPETLLTEDFRLYVQAYKKGIAIGGRLQQELTILVRPDPDKRLSIEKKEGMMYVRVHDSQPGVSYQLLDATDLTEIGSPVFHRRNRGIGVGMIERDFTLGGHLETRVLLPVGAVNSTKAYRVRATKIRTKLAVLLEQAITIEIRQ